MNKFVLVVQKGYLGTAFGGAQPLIMNKQKIYKFLKSLVAIPVMTAMIPLNGLVVIPNMALAINQSSTNSISVITAQEKQIHEDRAEKIDTFFKSYNSPLEGYGMKFVLEAEKNDIDWRLLSAIAMRESTGGKYACKGVPNSVFGYGSCKMSFKSIDESIEIVSASLGGNNPNTAHHYDGKTTLQILRKYNSVIKNYPQEVVRIMKMIDDTDEVI